MAFIMIVGEQTPFRNIISKSLTKEGHRVQSLENASRIIAETQIHRPHLVLLDLYLNEFDSYEVLLRLKQDNPKLPVLIYAIKCTDSLYKLKQCIQKALKETPGQDRKTATGRHLMTAS